MSATPICSGAETLKYLMSAQKKKNVSSQKEGHRVAKKARKEEEGKVASMQGGNCEEEYDVEEDSDGDFIISQRDAPDQDHLCLQDDQEPEGRKEEDEEEEETAKSGRPKGSRNKKRGRPKKQLGELQLEETDKRELTTLIQGYDGEDPEPFLKAILPIAEKGNKGVHKVKHNKGKDTMGFTGSEYVKKPHASHG
jgi:hypothetical protein